MQKSIEKKGLVDSNQCTTTVNNGLGELTGACPGFLKGGGPISLGSLKKGHQILKGGGGPVH